MRIEPELFEPAKPRFVHVFVFLFFVFMWWGEGGYLPRCFVLVRNHSNLAVLTMVCDTFISDQHVFIVRPMGCGGHTPVIIW